MIMRILISKSYTKRLFIHDPDFIICNDETFLQEAMFHRYYMSSDKFNMYTKNSSVLPVAKELSY